MSETERTSRVEARLAAALAATGGALALALLSASCLQRAGELQATLDDNYSVSYVSQALREPLQHDRQSLLRERVKQLLEMRELGLRYLAVADAAGIMLAVAGRYENLEVPLLPAAASRAARRWLYRMEGDFGRATVLAEERPLGSFEYAISAPLERRVRDQAIDQLRLAGVLGLLLSLPLAGGLLWLARREFAPRQLAPAQRLAQRLAPPADLPGESGRAGEQAQLLEQVRTRVGDTLDQFGCAIILTDREGRVRFLNQVAEALTGWSGADARTRPVHSVFHAFDDAGAPLLSAAESCVREGREVQPTRCRLRARGGRETPVEMMAGQMKNTDGVADGAAMLFRDISERLRELGDVQRQSRLSQGVIDHLDEGLVMTDPAGVVRFANARAQRMFGYGRDELDGYTVTKLMPVPFLNTPSVQLRDYIAGKNARQAPRVVGWRKDATTFPVELQVQPMNIGEDSGLILIVRDISERLRGENLASRLGRLLDGASEEIYILDAQTLQFLEVNLGARRNLGYTQEQLAQMTPLSISAELDAETFRGFVATLRGGDRDPQVYRCRHRRANGSDYPVEVRLSYSPDEEPPVFMAIAADISERIAAEDKLKHLAHHDPLTGLANRAVLYDRLRQALLAAGRSNRQVAVFFVDLDRFKQINDSLGHEVGDLVLQSAAERLSACVRGSDTVARFGGDEFVVVASDLRSDEDAEQLARKLLDAFRDRLDIPGHEAVITPSIGVALYPEDDSDAEGLLRHADSAMYQAKQAGRNCYRLFNADVDPERQRKLNLERGIHTAVALNEFHMQLAPVLDAGGAVRAALMSFWWQHPRYGAVGADEVLRAATRAGLLADLELWLICRSCTHYRIAAARGLPLASMIVAVSGWQLRDPDFAGHLLGVLERFRVPAQTLILALTRDGCAETGVVPAERIQQLTARGLRFALRDLADDAAAVTAESGLPLDLFMLADDLPARALRDAGCALRLRQVIESAAALGRPLMATGITDEAQQALLKKLGCRLFSGPLYSAQMNATEAAAWLAQQKTLPL